MTSILIPISPQIRSRSPPFSQIAVLPSWSLCTAFLVPDDKSIVPNVQSAPMPLLVRLTRFYGGMFPRIVGSAVWLVDIPSLV